MCGLLDWNAGDSTKGNLRWSIGQEVGKDESLTGSADGDVNESRTIGAVVAVREPALQRETTTCFLNLAR